MKACNLIRTFHTKANKKEAVVININLCSEKRIIVRPPMVGAAAIIAVGGAMSNPLILLLLERERDRDLDLEREREPDL